MRLIDILTQRGSLAEECVRTSGLSQLQIIRLRRKSHCRSIESSSDQSPLSCAEQFTQIHRAGLLRGLIRIKIL